MRIALALLCILGLEKRNQDAARKLGEAKAAYETALAKTSDFDCVSPEFDRVLALFDAVPAATPSKAEARDFAKRIREKRAAAARHAQALGRTAAPAVEEAAAAPPADPSSCKSAKKRMLALAAARKRAGKPPLGQMAFSGAGEVAYAPGAEPSAEEAKLTEVLKSCR